MKLHTLLFVIVGIAASAGAEAPRPNILYLYVDDMGWGSLGPNGQAARKAAGLPSVLTPNLDRLAAESVNFSRAYGCTVCSPARSSQQTGFHQGHTFADRNDPNNAKKAMRADDVLMGDALSGAGYTTGYWGKWGYGGSKDQANPVIENVQTLPTSHGYQFVLAELHHVRAHTFFQPTLWSAPAAPGAIGGVELIPNSMAGYRGKSEYPEEPALQNHPKYPEVAYCDDLYCFAALDFVRTQAKHYKTSGEPFFGLLAVQVPHAPFDEIGELPKWKGAYAKDPHFTKMAQQSQWWAAMVTRIDGHIGNLLDALEDPNGDGDLSDSVAENTLVIFMSDNGGPNGACNKDLDANGGLRGFKGSVNEGGIRVPMMMRWPAKLSSDSKWKAGTTSDYVIDVSDFLPTFCELSGAESPVGLDGVSFAPSLMGKVEDQREREYLIHEAGKTQAIIRGDDKLIMTAKGPELYDLGEDAAEEVNLAGKNRKLVKELQAALLAERVDEPRGFANTYHHWEGPDGGETSDPDNWSDYVYANAGVTYMTDAGAPQLSWTARMENAGKKPSVAKAEADLQFLGLEIKGSENGANQELRLESGIALTGRNEVRLAKGGILTVNGGRVSSQRWVDVKAGAELRGSGKIDSTLYNAGTVSLAFGEEAQMQRFVVTGDYQEKEDANMVLMLGNNLDPLIEVGGIARLAGSLSIELPEDASRLLGIRYSILRADQIVGQFENGGEVIAPDGTLFKISYTDKEVFLSIDGSSES